MRDGGKIVGGIAVLLAVAAGPFWLASVRGAKAVVLPRATDGQRCIEPREEMRKNHPALLASWRERAVRLGERMYHLDAGLDVRISLTGTCLSCHGKATEFCDKCHAQSAVTLSCWQCHEQSTTSQK
jgi:hypothetical protein